STVGCASSWCARSLNCAAWVKRQILIRSPLTLHRCLMPSGRNTTSPIRSFPLAKTAGGASSRGSDRSEEHTSELQSRFDLVCRLLLEKKKNRTSTAESNDSWAEAERGTGAPHA